MKQVSSSPDKELVLAFSLVWALVDAFKTVELELSQERFEPCLVESSLEYLDDCLFVFVVEASVGVDLE